MTSTTHAQPLLSDDVIRCHAGDTTIGDVVVEDQEKVEEEVVAPGPFKPQMYSRCRSLLHVKHVLISVVASTLASMLLGTQIPKKQSEVFGDNAYVIAGALGAAVGLSHMFITPCIGAMSDFFGRPLTVAVCTASMAIPLVLFGLGFDLAAFIVNVPLMLGHTVSAMFTAAATDVLPAAATTVDQPFVFGFGLAVGAITVVAGSSIGASINFRIMAGVAAAATLGAAALMWALLRCSPTEPPADLLAFEAEQLALREAHEAALAPPEFDIVDAPERPLAGALGRTSSTAVPPPLARALARTSSAGGAPTSVTDTDEAAIEAVLEHALARPKPAATLREHLARSWAQLRRNRQLQVITAVAALNGMAEQSMNDLMLLYVTKTLGYSSVDLIMVMSALTVGKLAAFFVVVPVTRSYCGMLWALRISIVCNGVWVAGFAFLGKPVWEGVVSCLFAAFTLGFYPLASAVAAQAVAGDPDAGLAQGVMAGGRALAAGLAPALIGTLFHYSQHTALPGFPLLVAVVFVFGAFGVTFLLKDEERGQPAPEDEVVEAEAV